MRSGVVVWGQSHQVLRLTSFGRPVKIPFMHQDKGACPWVNTIRRSKIRLGPNGHPVPGVAQFLKAHVDPVSFIVLPIEKLHEGGVLLGDIDCILKYDSGTRLLSEHSITIDLKPDMVAFIPMGWYVFPVHVDMRLKDFVPSVTYWSLPMFEATLAAAIDPKVLEAVLHINTNYMTKATGDVWKIRLKYIELFEESSKAVMV